MKKVAKTFLMTLIAAAAANVMAAIEINAGNQYVGFSTAPNPVYGDGSQVLSGERFALCWSLNGEFSGLKADGSAVETDTTKEKVLCTTRLTKKSNGEFGTTFVIPPSMVESNGYYEVLILDTRESADTLASTVKVNGVASANFKVSTSDPTLSKDGVAASSDYNAGAYIDTPASLEITVDGDAATVRAVNLSPALTYFIKYGVDLTELTTVPVNSGDLTKFGTVEVVIPGSEGKFFQLDYKK